MSHFATMDEGQDVNSFVGRCSCGYRFSSTWKATRQRMITHKSFFVGEHRAWNDPDRRAHMPPVAWDN